MEKGEREGNEEKGGEFCDDPSLLCVNSPVDVVCPVPVPNLLYFVFLLPVSATVSALWSAPHRSFHMVPDHVWLDLPPVHRRLAENKTNKTMVKNNIF